MIQQTDLLSILIYFNSSLTELQSLGIYRLMLRLFNQSDEQKQPNSMRALVYYGILHCSSKNWDVHHHKGLLLSKTSALSKHQVSLISREGMIWLRKVFECAEVENRIGFKTNLSLVEGKEGNLPLNVPAAGCHPGGGLAATTFQLWNLWNTFYRTKFIRKAICRTPSSCHSQTSQNTHQLWSSGRPTMMIVNSCPAIVVQHSLYKWNSVRHKNNITLTENFQL